MKTHRKIVVMGKGLQELIHKAIELKYLTIDQDRIGDLSNLSDKGVVVLISDEKEKPFVDRCPDFCDPAILYLTIYTILYTERWFQRTFHVSSHPAPLFYPVCYRNVRLVCCVGLSGLQKTRRRSDTLDPGNYHNHAVYRITNIFPKTF